MGYVIPFGISLILSFKTVAVSVSVTNFAQRFSCQISEYQQCETHDQHTPDKGTSWQFHGLLLLAQSAVRGYPDVVKACRGLVG